jgi:hypothetical protein
MLYAHSMAAEHQESVEKAHRASVVPHFINEDKSDLRGIKSGWYAMKNDGNLVGGPFTTYQKCAEGISVSRQEPSGCAWLRTG